MYATSSSTRGSGGGMGGFITSKNKLSINCPDIHAHLTEDHCSSFALASSISFVHSLLAVFLV